MCPRYSIKKKKRPQSAVSTEHYKTNCCNTGTRYKQIEKEECCSSRNIKRCIGKIKKIKKQEKKKPESFHFDPVYLRKEHTDLRMCFMGMIMTKTRLKAAVALSLCVGRFCAKSINMESSPHSVHAPTLRSHIHRLFTAQIFIHLCSCTPHAHTLTHTHTHTTTPKSPVDVSSLSQPTPLLSDFPRLTEKEHR